MSKRYTFDEGHEPVVLGINPKGWQWVDLKYAGHLPEWRRKAAMLADGRVVIAAENAFKNDRQLEHSIAVFGRPVASIRVNGHRYVETGVVAAANRKEPDRLADITRVEEVVRATVEGRIDIRPLVCS